MQRIKLNYLHCLVSDEIDKDEIYLKIDGKKIWPAGMYKRLDTGDKEPIGVTFEREEGEMEIELWDFDFITANDKLGVFKMKVDDEKDIFTTNLQLEREDSTASYVLEWQNLY